MEPIKSTNSIHSDAQVSPNAIIGKNNIIGKGAIVHDNVIIGDNNYIGPYVVIGEPGEYRNPPQVENVAYDCVGQTTVFLRTPGKIIIGNNNKIREFVAIQSPVLDEETSIGNDNYIMEKTHIAHDCRIGNQTTISPGVVLGGRVQIFNQVNLGINASIHPRIKVRSGAMIGMGAIITKEVQPWTKVVSVNKVLGWNTRGMEKAGWSAAEIEEYTYANNRDICAE